VRVRVPATSANIGPGFDSFGLALARHDVVEVAVGESDVPLTIEVEGEGAADVPRDATHLVARAFARGVETWADGPPGSVRLRCRNALPHSRGLGSSAAAIVAGLVAARALLVEPEHVADAELLDLGSRLEGHPDNVAACLSGGFAVSWMDQGQAHSVRLGPDPRVRPVVCVPTWPMSTEQARGLLPERVPHADAVFTAGRAALLVAAISQRPDLLLAATEDRLHQPYRASAMRPTADLVATLRHVDIPAVVSGAGPTVLALVADDAAPTERVRELAGPGWMVETLAVDERGAVVEYLDDDTRSAL